MVRPGRCCEMKIRDALYKTARVIGDAQAVKNNKIVKRVARRVAGKVVGKFFKKFFK